MENKIERREIPSINQTLIFKGKATLLQIKRGAENFLDRKVKSFRFASELKNKPAIAESKTELWMEIAPAERFLLAGKIQNLRVAVAKINGAEIPAGQIFSFWKQIGRATRRKGFVIGRELREGCIIPNVGGGLCQLSNALYDAALRANFEIIERHAHTRVLPNSLAEQGRDATVFWNYIDLRFRSPNAFRIEAKLDAKHLSVKFLSDKTKEKNLFQIQKRSAKPAAHVENCATCGVEDCFRVVKPPKNSDFGRTAFLVDEFSPEFDEYIQAAKCGKDTLFLPLDGKRFKKANYAWTTANFAKVRQSLLTTLIRSYKSRKLAAQGAERQKNLLAMAEKLAESYAKNLSFDVLHVVVSQNLLPFLWREGVLGGRVFDILMTNLPMKNLHERLDFAHSLHPESKTLGDFRADEKLIEVESEALKHANKIITPHTEIASLFPDKAELLNWHLPKAKERTAKIKNQKQTVIFPASTVGRKGVYELREALRGLDVRLVIIGLNFEGENFWHGFEVERGNAQNGWLENADLVVLPSFVENKPRRILEAAANQIPVIASKACGVESVENIETFETGNAEDLRLKLQNLLTRLS